MTRARLLLLAALAGCASSSPSAPVAQAPVAQTPAAPAPNAGSWTLSWSDEFDRAADAPVDTSRWGFDLGGGGWGNQELQFYTSRAENVAHDGRGNLLITAIAETPAGSSCWYGACRYTSARLLTKGKFAQAFGRFEARLKVPVGQGMWPAFWMLGDDIDRVGWPRSGEIDVMEHIGREPQTVHGTLHGPGYSGANGIGAATAVESGKVADDFHVYAVEWEPLAIRWYFDGKLYRTTTPADLPPNAQWVYDHPHFLLLNLAVGGQWPGAPDATTTFPQRLTVDYVRVYRRS
jgi:beta-glucanase (GH16 family)